MLKDYLKQNRWSVTAFAKEIGVDRRTIYNYIEGNTKPSKEIIEKMAKVLKVSTKQIKKLI